MRRIVPSDRTTPARLPDGVRRHAIAATLKIVVGERAFRIDAEISEELRDGIRAARDEGRLPDVLLADELIGDGPADTLEPVDVPVAEIEQLALGMRLPRWVIAKNPLSEGFVRTKALMRTESLVTVCEEAACPNIGRCWSRGTATFMISGANCTRGCRFCNVATARPAGPPDPQEPERVAEAAAQMGLSFVVVTAVARDDLPDGGAAHFAATIRALRERVPEARVEVLIPDLAGSWDALDRVIEAAPDVLNHNTETVPRLYSLVRPGARYERTLEMLARSSAAGLRTKSGIMVGLGESLPEIDSVFSDLASVGCDLVTVGQYLRPSAAHLPVARFYAPAEYPHLAELGRARGLGHVEAGPLVRSSFEADRVADTLGVVV
jgi:lipoic acid synthetase